jgi:putative DNA primase/helicase
MAQKQILTLPETQPAVEPAPKHDYLKLDDDILVLELAPRLKEHLAHFHSEWKMYENGVWRTRHAAELRRFVRAALRDYRHSGVQVNQRRITSICAMLEDDLFIADKDVSAMHGERARYINLANGIYNLETFELEPHRRDLFFTTQLDFAYDPDADCPTFRQYLKRSLVFPDGKPDPELVRLVNQALGYSMTARTDMKASFWLVGERDSGKSTFISVIKGIMGDLHTTVDLTQLGVNRFLLAGIVGKRVVTFTEASEGAILDDAKFKTLVGGSDDIFVDVKNKPAISFRPEAKIWWAMNGLPRITDRSGATTRRITIIPFNRSIPQHERIIDLEARLLRERAGIFTAVMFDLARVVRQGHFDLCAQSEEQIQQYIAENDTEATYVEQCAEVHPSYSVRGAELYSSYAQWCQSNGFKPKNLNQVAKDWRRLGFNRRHSDGAVWEGLKIATAKVFSEK